MNKISNKNYRQFLDSGIITLIGTDRLTQALDNIKEKYTREGRALLITLYYTGARPNEVLRLKAEDIKKESSFITIQVPGSKGGLPRKVYIPLSRKYIMELLHYSKSWPENYILFYHYQSKYVRKVINKKGVMLRKDISNKLGYYVRKWFNGVLDESISPYYLRHNKFSQLAMKGATMDMIRQVKGSRTFESCMAYIHMSTDLAKKAARLNM